MACTVGGVLTTAAGRMEAESEMSELLMTKKERCLLEVIVEGNRLGIIADDLGVILWERVDESIPLPLPHHVSCSTYPLRRYRHMW